MKAREEADLGGSKDTNKVTLQSVLQRNKKSAAVEDLYEMQAVRSSAHEFREKKLKGQIPYDNHTDQSHQSNKNKSSGSKNAGGASAGHEEKRSNWIPLLTAILGIFSLTIFSANKLNAQADHIQDSDSALALELPSNAPASASSSSSSAADASSITIHHDVSNKQTSNPIQQQPLWLQRPRSESRLSAKP
jgi:hypothetical protein